MYINIYVTLFTINNSSVQRGEHHPWPPVAARSQQPRTSSLSEEDNRKRLIEQDLQHQRHMSQSSRDHRGGSSSYYNPVQRSASVPGKAEYPPPAHSRPVATNKVDKVHPSMQKTDLSSLYSHHAAAAAYQQQFYEPKSKVSGGGVGGGVVSGGGGGLDHHKTQQTASGLVVTKAQMDGRDVIGETKTTVIVKHDTKSPYHMDQRGSVPSHHSPSPKQQRGDIVPSSAQTPKRSGIYDYPPNPNHSSLKWMYQMPQTIPKSATSDHRSSSGQLPSPHQRQSPHPHPHAQQHTSPDMRYRTTPETQAMIYPTCGSGDSGKSSSGASYPPFLSAGTTTAASAFALSQTSSVNSKPKVSSPAPHHFYGKPNSVGGGSGGGGSGRPSPLDVGHGVPMQLTAKPTLTNVSSPYQQMSQSQPPHPPQHTPPMQNPLPPPAHSRTTSSIDRLYSPGSAVKLTGSPPTAASAPLPLNHGRYGPSLSVQGSHSSIQTQPLDLVASKYESSVSPKRKASAGSPVCLEKKRKLDTPSPGLPPPQPQLQQQQQQQHHLQHHSSTMYVGGGQQPQLSRVSEPSPLIASAATTITTMVNTLGYRTPPNTTTAMPLTSQPPASGMGASAAAAATATALTNNLPDVSVTTVWSMVAPSTIASPSPPPSGPRQLNAASPPSAPTPEEPSPVKTPTPAAISQPAPPPSAVDSEKSNSPGPIKTSTGSGSSYPVRHLKKAWLQRHTGEDPGDTAGVVGSGSCVTLPIKITSTPANSTATAATAATTVVTASPKENPVNSIHNVGSLAVNSISKSNSKHLKTATNRKTAAGGAANQNKDQPSTASSNNATTTVNGHPPSETGSKGAAGDDSSSSDQERGRKSPPKRKPPKVKRKKGGGGSAAAAAKKASEEKKRKTSGGAQSTAAASESGSDSEKESGSDKDSDSGASTAPTGTKKTTNSSNNSGGGSGGSGGGGGGKEPRKRGRRPKSSKNDKGEEPRSKKSKEDSTTPQRDPFRKPPVGHLKKTGESFLQDGPCFEVAPKLAKCRECRWTPNQRSKNMPNIFCRFYAFRRLRYTKNGQLAIAGFSDPHKDATEVRTTQHRINKSIN